MWMAEYRCHAYARKRSYYKNRPQSLYPRMDTILRLALTVARFHCIAVTSAVIERKTWNQFWLDRHQSLVLHSNSMQKRCNCLCAPNRVYLFTIYKTKTEKWKRCWTKRSHQPDAVLYKQPTERTKHILWSDEIMYVFRETNIWGKKLVTKIKCFNWFKWIFAGFFFLFSGRLLLYNRWSRSMLCARRWKVNNSMVSFTFVDRFETHKKYHVITKVSRWWSLKMYFHVFILMHFVHLFSVFFFVLTLTQ